MPLNFDTKCNGVITSTKLDIVSRLMSTAELRAEKTIPSVVRYEPIN